MMAGSQQTFLIQRVPGPPVIWTRFGYGMNAIAKRGRSQSADHQRGCGHDRARRG